MVEVNGAYIHGMYKKNVVKQFACNFSYVFATQDRWMNMTHYIDPYDIRMDQKSLHANTYNSKYEQWVILRYVAVVLSLTVWTVSNIFFTELE